MKKQNEKSITFNSREILSILNNEKTQFRIPFLGEPIAPACIYDIKNVQPKPAILNTDRGVYVGFSWKYENLSDYEITNFKCPYFVGQKLWVKETFFNKFQEPKSVMYKADEQIIHFDTGEKTANVLFECENWESAQKMPRWASRIELEVKNIRVEKIQSISEDDAISEGMGYDDDPFYNEAEHAQIGGVNVPKGPFVYSFFSHFGRKSKKQAKALELNYFTWVIEFKMVEDVKVKVS